MRNPTETFLAIRFTYTGRVRHNCPPKSVMALKMHLLGHCSEDYRSLALWSGSTSSHNLFTLMNRSSEQKHTFYLRTYYSKIRIRSDRRCITSPAKKCTSDTRFCIPDYPTVNVKRTWARSNFKRSLATSYYTSCGKGSQLSYGFRPRFPTITHSEQCSADLKNASKNGGNVAGIIAIASRIHERQQPEKMS